MASNLPLVSIRDAGRLAEEVASRAQARGRNCCENSPHLYRGVFLAKTDTLFLFFFNFFVLVRGLPARVPRLWFGFLLLKEAAINQVARGTGRNVIEDRFLAFERFLGQQPNRFFGRTALTGGIGKVLGEMLSA